MNDPEDVKEAKRAMRVCLDEINSAFLAKVLATHSLTKTEAAAMRRFFADQNGVSSKSIDLAEERREFNWSEWYRDFVYERLATGVPYRGRYTLAGDPVGDVRAKGWLQWYEILLIAGGGPTIWLRGRFDYHGAPDKPDGVAALGELAFVYHWGGCSVEEKIPARHRSAVGDLFRHYRPGMMSKVHLDTIYKQMREQGQSYCATCDQWAYVQDVNRVTGICINCYRNRRGTLRDE